MTSPVRIAVLGAAGKMGRALVRAVAETPGCLLSAAVDREGSPELGRDSGLLAGLAANQITLGSALPQRDEADVWIDFSAAAATAEHAQQAASSGARLVVGTTGLSAAQRLVVINAGSAVPVVLSPNMSVGVNVLLDLVQNAARSLGADYDIEIVEAHHRMKRDAPSGTALRLFEALAEATGRDPESSGRFERHGDLGPRTAGEIGVQTIRGGDVIGDHTVFFLGMGERIELTHRASSRDTFARGAVRAALWLASKPAGVYDMRDVLGLKK